MGKLHLIMPMAGGGTRFAEKGYCQPKPMIELLGKPFFYWAVQSVVKFIDVCDITFVVLQEHVDQFAIDREIKTFYPKAKIRSIPHMLNGALLTCLEGIKDISDDLPVLFNDCDHAFLCRLFYEYCRKEDAFDLDGALLTFYSDSPSFSYVRFDAGRNVTGTVEKKVVSDEAVCGAYCFKNRIIFEEAAEIYLENCAYQEFFMSGIYNVMAKENKKLATFKVDKHISFGTPDEYGMAVCNPDLGEFA